MIDQLSNCCKAIKTVIHGNEGTSYYACIACGREFVPYSIVNSLSTKNNNYYDNFVREGRVKGFTDDQIDFIWEWIVISVENPEALTHEDNYVKDKLT